MFHLLYLKAGLSTAAQLILPELGSQEAWIKKATCDVTVKAITYMSNIYVIVYIMYIVRLSVGID